MTKILVASALTSAALVLAACSSSSGSPARSTHSAPPAVASTAAAAGPAYGGAANPTATTTVGTVITIKNFGYSGALSVKPGARITVVNDDSMAHTLTDKTSHRFDTGTIKGSGGKGAFTAPTKPGKYPFGCNFHPEMSGVLIVR